MMVSVLRPSHPQKAAQQVPAHTCRRVRAEASPPGPRRPRDQRAAPRKEPRWTQEPKQSGPGGAAAAPEPPAARADPPPRAPAREQSNAARRRPRGVGHWRSHVHLRLYRSGTFCTGSLLATHRPAKSCRPRTCRTPGAGDGLPGRPSPALRRSGATTSTRRIYAWPWRFSWSLLPPTARANRRTKRAAPVAPLPLVAAAPSSATASALHRAASLVSCCPAAQALRSATPRRRPLGTPPQRAAERSAPPQRPERDRLAIRWVNGEDAIAAQRNRAASGAAPPSEAARWLPVAPRRCSRRSGSAILLQPDTLSLCAVLWLRGPSPSTAGSAWGLPWGAGPQARRTLSGRHGVTACVSSHSVHGPQACVWVRAGGRATLRRRANPVCYPASLLRRGAQERGSVGREA